MGKMRTYNNEMREMTSSLMSFQDDTFQNIQTVKALDLTGVFEKKLQSFRTDTKKKCWITINLPCILLPLCQQWEPVFRISVLDGVCTDSGVGISPPEPC